MTERFENELKKINGGAVLVDEPLKAHTTFRIGGVARFVVTPNNIETLAETIRLCNREQVPYYVIGNGSNLLVSDTGYQGVIIRLYRTLDYICVEGEQLIAGAGALLVSVCRRAMHEGLTGMEFASGIPGTIGGALVMNAGAYGGEMKDIVREVTIMSPQGEVRKLTGEEMNFGYRRSIASEQGLIILEARLKLETGVKEEIESKMRELSITRKEKQPLEYPSAGSTFKRPEGYFAGKLIDDAGLRGYQVGGARVSDKHCGFVINTGDATAADVIQLIQDVRNKVKLQAGVTLEPEVKLLGDFEILVKN